MLLLVAWTAPGFSAWAQSGKLEFSKAPENTDTGWATTFAVILTLGAGVASFIRSRRGHQD